ncbi:AMP-binding protein [Dactylosporangium aurantiacum]|uniref:AMP-binding protein n=2 Tax=Dactylosporangium aurantiacum TaxID=35754 RepID=A0A9Q9IVB1_9ACTN|nr:AMP-binding protein [Dactylosporangium aurantiacum]
MARSWLSGLPDGRGLNIAHEAVDRHAGGPLRDKVALRCLGPGSPPVELTYEDLRRRTNRFAGALAALGIDRGGRVFTLLPRGLDLVVAALGTVKCGGVSAPLSAACGPDEVRARLVLGAAAVLVTTPQLYERTVAPVRDAVPGLRHVLVTGDGAPPPGTSRLDAALAEAGDRFEIPPTDPGQTALLQFTAGTSGRAKGTVHVHEAVVAHHATARFALDLRPEDVFWCTADPGCGIATSYGIVAPLSVGATVVVDTGRFDARRWCSQLQAQRVTVWYTTAAAVRMLMRHGDPAAGCDLSALRLVASTGGPLEPEAVRWGLATLGHPVQDTWWQTETGAIMISNFAGLDLRPGSMGFPVPGIEAALLAPGGGAVRVVDAPDEVGELALRAGWPSMFRGYLHDEPRYARCFAAGWYRSGDLARRDADGYYWFAGRSPLAGTDP